MAVIQTEYIKLSQFLKLMDIAGSGGEAKILARTLKITVNGEPENRPGRKLYPGDVVVVNGRKMTIE